MARKTRMEGYVNAMNRKGQAAKPASSVRERLAQMKQKNKTAKKKEG